MKIEKILETTYCLRCKDYTHNFRSQEIKSRYNKYTGNTFPKKLLLISKNRLKGKSRCTICLTERSFIHEIEYDLESELEIYLQFSTD